MTLYQKSNETRERNWIAIIEKKRRISGTMQRNPLKNAKFVNKILWPNKKCKKKNLQHVEKEENTAIIYLFSFVFHASCLPFFYYIMQIRADDNLQQGIKTKKPTLAISFILQVFFKHFLLILQPKKVL